MEKFDGIMKTKTGIECKNVKFNSAANLYLGMVKDGWSSDPNRPWTSCSWKKSGKCVNSSRPELDLEVTIKVYDCPVCNRKTTAKWGVCDSCEDEGYWIDPAGGLHHDEGTAADEFEDPAKMYE